MNLSAEEIDAIARRVIELLRQPAGAVVNALPPAREELMSVSEVAQMLKCSARTVRRRASTPGDAIFRARSRVNQKRPMLFCRSKIEGVDREDLDELI